MISTGITQNKGSAYQGPWGPWQAPAKDIYQQAMQLFSQGPPAYYQDPTVVGPNSMQTTANTGIYNMMPQTGFGNAPMGWQDAMRGGQAGRLGLMGQVLGGTNPYLAQQEQAGINAITKNFQESVLPQIGAGFRQRGAGGGSAHALAMGRAAEGLTDSVGRYVHNLRSGAYESDAGRRLAASQALHQGGLGALSMMPGLQQAAYAPYLMARDAGTWQQQQDQQMRDADIARHNYESGAGGADWLSQYVNMILGHPMTTSTQTSKGGAWDINVGS